MDKRDFLNRLQEQLNDLTSEERREALEYYEEYFADAGEENEADVLLSLGSPEQVAKQIKAGLHKADEGMFTENGYREKVENDNPPDVYGKKEEKQKSKGPLPWGHGKQKNTDYQNASGGYHENGYHSNGYHSSGQNGYYYGGQWTEKKKNNLSGGMIALFIILGICASPVILALGAGLLGVAIGILGAIFGVIVAILAVIVALFAVGIGLFVMGFPMMFSYPFTGMCCIASGCVLISLFILCAILLVAIFGKFFPWLIREVESFGKYLSRKWSERKRKGGKTA